MSKRWAMVIDLRRCFGCNTCVSACSQSNKVPERFWRNVKDLGIINGSGGKRLLLPVSCMHCENPSCMTVCPTGATKKRDDGIVAIDADKCVGCGYCILACPYRARSIFYEHHNFELECSASFQDKIISSPKKSGICTKCNFCLPKVKQGLDDNLEPGKDDTASPACVVACSADALTFGDMNDPKSKVARLLQENETIRLAEEKGTEPTTYYIIDDREGK